MEEKRGLDYITWVVCQRKESYLNKIDDRSRKAGFFFHLNQKQLQPFQEDSFSFSLIKLHFVNQDKYIIRFEKKN